MDSTAQASIRTHSNDELVLRIFRRRNLGLFKENLRSFPKGPRAAQIPLSPRELGSRDHLHGLRDLLHVLRALEAQGNALQGRHPATLREELEGLDLGQPCGQLRRLGQRHFPAFGLAKGEVLNFRIETRRYSFQFEFRAKRAETLDYSSSCVSFS